MNKKKKNKWYAGVVIFVIALVCHDFFCSSFQITSDSMSDNLLKGDHVLAIRSQYGIRLPQTPVAIPFIHDTIPGTSIPSYFKFLKFPYWRLFTRRVKRNEVVFYNLPVAGKQVPPIDRLKIDVSRVVGLPGDTIELIEKATLQSLKINGVQFINDPLSKAFYSFPYSELSVVKQTLLAECQTTLHYLSQPNDNLAYCLLNNFEYYTLNTHLGSTVELKPYVPITSQITLVLPQKGVLISHSDFEKYRMLVLQYEGVDLALSDAISYRFKYDYYWMLSDNHAGTIDSRLLGAIPETHLIGKAFCIWLSRDSKKRFFSSFRKARFFKMIE